MAEQAVAAGATAQSQFDDCPLVLVVAASQSWVAQVVWPRVRVPWLVVIMIQPSGDRHR